MFERITVNLSGELPFRKETLNGREFYAVPAAILEEGVWEGSGGPLYYPADELAKSVPNWNHKPVVVYHPDKDGRPTSACDPVVLNSCGVGLLLNTKYDTKLRTEVWLDVEKARSVDKRVVEAVESHKPVEVSTGLYTTNVKGDGEFNGKKYVATARDYATDHLAVLPDKVGAYSIKDGGGTMTVNAGRLPERSALVAQRTVERALACVGVTLVGNELSFSDTSCQLRELLASAYGEPGKYWDGYVVAVYPDYVVFKDGYDSPTMKVGYSVSGDVVSLVGAAAEVVQVTSYEPVNNEEKDMAFDKKAHVAALVGNGFDEADRAWLEKLPDDALAKVKPAAKKEEPPPVTNVSAAELKELIANAIKGGSDSEAQLKKIVEAIAAKKEPTLKDLVANADPRVKAQFARLEKLDKEERDRLVANVLAVEGQPYTKEYLEGVDDIDDLRALVALAGAAVKAAGGEQPVNNAGHPKFNNAYLGAAGGPPTGAPPVPAQTLPIVNVEFDNPFAK